MIPIVLWSSPSNSAEVTLNWTPPTHKIDDSLLTDLASYEIWHGCTQPGVYDFVEVALAPISSYIVANLPEGRTCYFAVKSTRATGVSSVFSNEASKFIPAGQLPGQVINLQITWQASQPNGLPPGWLDSLIDGGQRNIRDSSLDYSAGRWTIFHEGGEIWDTADHFRAPTFAIEASNDLSFSADVVASHTGTLAQYPKAGPMLRASLDPAAPHVYANIIGVAGARGHNISFRLAAGDITDKVNFTDPLSLCWSLRIDVDGALGSWRAYRSASCINRLWVQYAAGQADWLLQGSQITAALACTPNDRNDFGLAGECIVDNLTIAFPVIDHSSAGN